MADSFKIILEITFHLYGYPILKEVLPLGQDLRRQVSHALLGKLTVRGAAEIHLGVYDLEAALFARAGRLILKELHLLAALGTGHLKNGI
jgi:hypothetical protein